MGPHAMSNIHDRPQEPPNHRPPPRPIQDIPVTSVESAIQRPVDYPDQNWRNGQEYPVSAPRPVRHASMTGRTHDEKVDGADGQKQRGRVAKTLKSATGGEALKGNSLRYPAPNWKTRWR